MAHYAYRSTSGQHPQLMASPYRHRRINAAKPTAAWRSEPATAKQWKVLRRIELEDGITFSPTVTKGDASKVIKRRFDTDPDAARAHRHARRKRARKARQNGSTRPSPIRKTL